jgi:hypothetical protein
MIETTLSSRDGRATRNPYHERPGLLVVDLLAPDHEPSTDLGDFALGHLANEFDPTLDNLTPHPVTVARINGIIKRLESHPITRFTHKVPFIFRHDSLLG